jgi:hypothetical protein
MESGAHVSWKGDDVIQDVGDVFYRVEKGKQFVVHTPQGDVTVHGTCFRVKVVGEDSSMNKREAKVAVVGALAGALTLVGVYEGKVALSHAKSAEMLGPGEAAASGKEGVTRVQFARVDGAHGGRAIRDVDFAALAARDEATDTANKNLVEQVSDYKNRLELLQAQKKQVEARLSDAEKKLATENNGGTPPRNEYDLRKEDWAEMAKTGEYRFRAPCSNLDGWQPSPDDLNDLGLSTQDGAAIRDAFRRTAQQTNKEMKPLCVKVLGSEELADKLADMCDRIVNDYSRSLRNKEGASGAEEEDPMKFVAEVRAGLRPMPGPNDPVSPGVRSLLIKTGAIDTLEAELAKSFGPDEAHRIAYSDNACADHTKIRTKPAGKPGAIKPVLPTK